MLFHVIDDEPIICEYVSELLQELGHEALTFHSPAEYLNFLENDEYVSPTAILSDLSMPLMSGGEMIKRVQAICPDQRFVVMSGKPNMQEMYKNSSFMFLNKPFGVKQFEAAIGALNTQKAA